MTPRAYEFIESLKKLDKKEQAEVAKAIVNDRLVDIGSLLVMYISNLQEERDAAAQDIVKVADAGVALSEKTVKRVAGVKGNTKSLTPGMELAFVRCLLEAGAYERSPFGAELRGSIDVSGMDEDWYKWAWQPKSKVYPIKGQKDKTE